MFLSLCLFPRLDVSCISYYRFTVIQEWKIPVYRIVLSVSFFFSLEVETTASKYAECMGLGGGIPISSPTWTLQPANYKLFKSFLDRRAPLSDHFSQ